VVIVSDFKTMATQLIGFAAVIFYLTLTTTLPFARPLST
jgi:hypothetical protein